MLKITKKNKGVSVVEILVVVAVLLIAFMGILALLTFSLQISTLMKETTQANSLAQEAVEAVRNFRDGTDWSTDGLGTLDIGVIYHPEKTTDVPPKWTMIQGTELINGFSREIVFANAWRNANDNIVQSGGTEDPETKKINIAVFWKNKKVEIITYLTNWQ